LQQRQDLFEMFIKRHRSPTVLVSPDDMVLRFSCASPHVLGDIAGRAQIFPNLHPFPAVHIQHLYRRPPGRSEPSDDGALEHKMFVLRLLAWIEQGDQRSCL
jgi:hypothetical protein